MSSLKSDASGRPRVSHEAKLGMAVITILVFAFCFLVYHKMDLHQRQMTQASIASTAGGGSPSLPLDTSVQLAGQSEQSAATDPLIKIEDLSTGSPFADPGMSRTESAVTEDSSIVAFGELTETVAPGTSSASTEADSGFTFTEPTESGPPITESSEISGLVADETPLLNGDSIPEFGRLESAVVEPDQSLTGQTSPNVDVDRPEFGSAASSDGSRDDLTITASEGLSLVDAGDSEPAFADVTGPTISTQNGSSVTDEGDMAITFDESKKQADNGATSQTDSEPMLLAMAEPQQDEPFLGGLNADDPGSSGVTAGRAPVTEPAESFSEFDAIDAADSTSNEDTRSAAKPQSTISGSKGFNAVTQPSGKTNRNSIRTAAGSGADGKFSLAAFNYQNNKVEPAPDDGSSFESVVVQDGDNYSKISKRVYGTVRYFSALAVFNQHRIAEPKHMRPGMIVLTPTKEVLEERYPQLFVDSQPKVVERAAFLLLEDGSPAYRVGERETLSEISQRFLGRSSRWVEIYRLNQTVVKDPNKLKAGLILALPADATEVNVAP